MRILRKLLFIPLFISLISCEDVVEIPLKTPESRLVVNAPLEWKKGTDGSYQIIELSKTAGYYDEAPAKVSGAVVIVTNSEGTVFNFPEGDTPGIYICTNFQPMINEIYELEIKYGGETYIASEQLYPVVNFDYTETFDLPGGMDGYEIRAFFTDTPNDENFYLLKETNSRISVPGYHTFNDKFFDGNQNYASHFDENIEAGDYVDFKLYGISSQHHDYLFKLLSSVQGGPFQPVPGINTGNIINITQKENYALGYFSLSETSTITHMLE